MKTLFTTLVCWLLISVSAFAVDVNDFTFHQLTHSDGLCSQRIYSITQTEDGAVWWAAKNCVERYNGVTVKCYTMNAPDQASFHAGRYLKLFYSTAGVLYAFDNKGQIFEYEHLKDSFKLIANLRQSQGEEFILNDIYVDESVIWLAAGDGIYRLESDVVNIKSGFAANGIVKVGKRFFFCTSDGLLEYKSGDFKNLEPHNIVSGFYDADNDRLWLGTFSNGVKVISFANNGKVNSISHVRTATRNSSASELISKPVRSLCMYDNDVLLVGIDGMGVYMAERNPDASGVYNASVLFDANDGEQGVLHGNGVYSLICDTWGNIIIGSYSGGIDIAHPVGMASKLFRHQYNNHQSILNDHVNCAVQMPDGRLAMGTDNGVSIYDAEGDKWIHASEGSVVIDLCVLSDGRILAATYGDGVVEIYANGKSRQVYSVANGILKDNYVYRIFEDNSKGLWIGCLNGPLVYLKNGKSIHFNLNNIKDITQLPDSRVAVGTVSGIFCVDSNTGQISSLDYYSPDSQDINKYVCAMHLQDDTHLWIGTDGGGIYVYEIATGQCRQITASHGLPSNTISSISADVYGRILISTDYGLAYIDGDDPDKVVNVNYGYEVDREYVGRAVAGLSDGHVLYGTTTGAVIISPENLKELDYLANLNFLHISCDGCADDFTEQHRQIHLDSRVNLKYSHRTFELHFECINLSNQNDIVYQYKVGKGEWSKPSSVQYIRFMNLEPGRHDLHLRCVSRSCSTLLDEEKIEIHIARPWWNSSWMWVLYVVLIILLFYASWYFYQLHTQYMRLVVNNPNLISVTMPGKMIVENIRSRAKEASSSSSSHSDDGKDFVDKATSLIVQSLSDSNFNIDQLCHEMAMSRTMFYVKLKAYTGKSPQDFIRVIRLERAAALLRSGRPVSEVADLTGFDNAKYFSTVFKKYFGISPSKYR